MACIDLVFTLDGNYLPHLQTLLTAIHSNNPGDHFRVHLMHRRLTDAQLGAVDRQCTAYGDVLVPVAVDPALFAGAPVSRQYPQEMYDRMLAPFLLPADRKRVLYLDPDTLVINPLRPLWETDLQGNLFAAAAHSGKTELINSVNRVRLNTSHDYYNSGVLLIDLEAGRREIQPDRLFQYAAAHTMELLLPDQDMLNALFGDRILPLDDRLWNYDARDYRGYLFASGGLCRMDWVMQHTAILHFCGKSKPWQKGYPYRFGVLYQHYVQLTRRSGFLMAD